MRNNIYSISGKFDKILLKIAFNTIIKYILKLIIKELVFQKMHSFMATYAESFSAMMRKMCIILLTLENSFFVLLI